jgi:hypothetical protein
VIRLQLVRLNDDPFVIHFNPTNCLSRETSISIFGGKKLCGFQKKILFQ